jgi:hypothetical protein
MRPRACFMPPVGMSRLAVLPADVVLQGVRLELDEQKIWRDD